MLVQRSCNINVTRIRDGWKDPTIRLFSAELKAQVPIGVSSKEYTYIDRHYLPNIP